MKRPHKNGCTCADCKLYACKANKMYTYRQQQRARGVVYDIDLVPPGDAWLLVTDARAKGMTFDQLVTATGCAKSTLMKLITQPERKIYRKTRNKIVNSLADGDLKLYNGKTRVPITIERQMILSLMAQGWTKKHLAEILRNNNRGSGVIVETIFKKKTKTAYYRNLQQIYWLVEVIGDKVGPSSKGAKTMQTRGVFPLKHYNVDGSLNERTLNPQQLAAWRRVQS